MSVTLTLLPIFLLIVTGQVLRRLDFPGAAFWPPAERLLYYVLFPALLIDKLTYAQYPPEMLQKALIAIPLALLAASVVLFAVQRLQPQPGPQFTSIYQGGIRFNSYLGLAAVQGLLGDNAVAIMAVCMAIMIPILNIACILVFHHANPNRAPGWKSVFRTVAGNPLIIGCVIGLGGNLLGWQYPIAVNRLMDYLGGMALPLGLLCVGAALELRAVSRSKGAFLWACGFKLLLMPALLAGIGLAVDVSAATYASLVILGTLPTATASYILARQLGGDAPLMAGIISAQTLLAMLSMPLMIPLLLPLGAP